LEVNYPKEMPEHFTVKKGDDSIRVLSRENGKVMASLEIKEWETEFFKRTFGSLTIDYGLFINLPNESIHSAFETIILYADENHYDILELHLDILGMQIIPVLEEKGFRLVDTRATFITLIEKKHIDKYSSDIGKICFATKTDFERILSLTHKSLTHNPSFLSRFKNRSFFTQQETERFYSAYIENYLDNKDVLFSIWKREDQVIGYFIYKLAGHYNGKQIYKGILTAVDPEYRGHNAHLVMQSFLYGYFPEEQFYLDNTTQLTNFPTIKNHIRSQKTLNRIDLTFYRPKGGKISSPGPL
jgi:hypothetical protein